MPIIKTNRGVEVTVCQCHYDLVNQYDWHIGSKGYVCTSVYDRSDKPAIARTVRMHRLIMNSPPYHPTDHINGNILDNRCTNLRLVTPQENAQNRKGHNTSGYKGVYRHGRRWIVYISVDKKNTYGGSYGTAKEAAEAYNQLALKYRGKFAWLNPV